MRLFWRILKMKLDFKSLPWRIAVGVAVPVFALAGALFLYFFRIGPPCPIYAVSGIYCIGCGAGRACVAILHGDLLGAMDYNLLFVVLLPFVAYFGLKVYISYVFGRDILPFPKIKLWSAIVIVAVIVAFGVLRNIPVEPLSYLAP